MKGFFKVILCGLLFCVLFSVHLLGAGVCARVVMQIEQDMTLEREGFEARLTLNNGLPTDMEDFSVLLKFFDDKGEPVAVSTTGAGSGLFYYRLQAGSSVPNTILTGSSIKVAYLIVPAPGAAGEVATGASYKVSATVRYKTGGTEQIIEVEPDTIQVRPMPQLQLQYFLPRDVSGDDPMTDEVEPIVPYMLGVRVMNHSPYATARSVAISSGRPEVTENKNDLLIDFSIIGCEVNGGGAQASLDVNFGRIAPQRAATANWWMTSSLSGKFVRFTAELSHAPEYGGALTSLIPSDAISTHRLLGRVLVDLPGSDALPDFLACSSMSGNISLPTVHESDTDEVNSYVDYYGQGHALVSLSSLGTSGTKVLFEGNSRLLYVRQPSPVASLKDVRALRADGKVLPSANCWISKSRNDADAWEYWLNIFDTNNLSGLSYTVTFTEPQQVNRPPELQLPGGLSYQASVGHHLSIPVSATDPDGGIPSLSSSVLPEGAVFTDAKDGHGTLVWTPKAGQLGTFTTLVRASDGLLSAEKSLVIVVTAEATVGYAPWQNRYWPGVTDQAIIGPAADPDGDQIPNLMEYALNADPTVSDDSILPRIGSEELEGLRYLTLSYVRRLDDAALKYEVVGSDNLYAPLADWTVQTQLLPADQSDLPETSHRIRVCDAVPLTNATTHRYLRLRVTRIEN